MGLREKLKNITSNDSVLEELKIWGEFEKKTFKDIDPIQIERILSLQRKVYISGCILPWYLFFHGAMTMLDSEVPLTNSILPMMCAGLLEFSNNYYFNKIINFYKKRREYWTKNPPTFE
ncbi:hypothetical protein J4461_00860 [Candidatus Pacearchaeota archaeon]|nr:hypothetical protein [Candidatus Pacearchaeota archaeon]